MNEKKRNKEIVKDPVKDPAFYNDQIDENKMPVKEMMSNKNKQRKNK